MAYNEKHIGVNQKIVIDSGGVLNVADGGELQIAGTAIAATAAELNRACDVSARVQALTVSGAVTAGVQSIELNHATVAVAATIASLVNHQGLLVIKDTSASGTAAHTVTVTTGTFDGTNKKVTLNAPNECILFYIDSAGNGTIVENVGSVALAAS